MAKYSSTKEQNKVEPFLMIKTWELKCPAFRALTGDEARIYMEIRMRYNGKNNGYIVFGGKTAGKAIHKSKATGSRALNRLVELKFLKIMRESSFDQKGHCQEYELTAISNQPAKKNYKLPDGTKDFMMWTEKLIRALDEQKKLAKVDRKKAKRSCTHETDSCTHETAPSNIVNFGGKS